MFIHKYLFLYINKKSNLNSNYLYKQTFYINTIILYNTKYQNNIINRYYNPLL